MAFVNRFIVLSGSVAASTTAAEVETFTVREGTQVTTVGMYTDENSDVDYTLKVNETTVLDNVNGANLPNAEDPLRYEVALQPGDDLTFIADNNNTSTAQTPHIIMMVEDTSQSFPDGGG